jgi:glycerophosphoryl diester phosphodiesterase
MRNVLRSIRCGSPMSLAWRLFAVAVAASFAATLPAKAVDLQGHRGARGLTPENTLAGFRRAIEIGVTTLETDLALAADDLLVLSHDPALNRALTRTGDGRWLSVNGPPIRSLTSIALRAYDVGRIDPSHEYAKPWTQQVAVDGERIPTLSQLFALARDARSPGGRPVHLNIETKLTPDGAVPTAAAEEFARAVAREVAAAGMTERVTVQSFDWRTLRALKRIAPSIRTACLTVEAEGMNTVREDASGASPWHDGLKRSDYADSLPRTVQAAGCSAWSPLWRNLTPELVGEARGLGLAVVPWTVNEPADIERMLDLGVDGLITDYPDRARRVLARRGVAVD